MSKWIAEFDLEDGDSMPEHMDLNYEGIRLDFHCKPYEAEWIKKEIIESGNFETGGFIIKTYKYVCSNCGIVNASKYKSFCPNCGRKMKEKTNEV